jgi:hypothetical protein
VGVLGKDLGLPWIADRLPSLIPCHWISSFRSHMPI